MAGLFDLLSTGAVGQAVSSKRREQEEQMNTFKQVANRSAELQQRANAELSLMKKKADLSLEIEKEQAPYFDAKRKKIAGENFAYSTKVEGMKYNMKSLANLGQSFENTQKALETLEIQNAGIGSKLKTIDNQIALYTDLSMKNTDATIKGNAEMSIIKLRGEKNNLLAQQAMNNVGIGQTKNNLLKTYERIQNTKKIATRSYDIDLGTSFIEKPTFQQKIFGGSTTTDTVDKPKESGLYIKRYITRDGITKAEYSDGTFKSLKEVEIDIARDIKNRNLSLEEQLLAVEKEVDDIAKEGVKKILKQEKIRKVVSEGRRVDDAFGNSLLEELVAPGNINAADSVWDMIKTTNPFFRFLP